MCIRTGTDTGVTVIICYRLIKLYPSRSSRAVQTRHQVRRCTMCTKTGMDTSVSVIISPV